MTSSKNQEIDDVIKKSENRVLGHSRTHAHTKINDVIKKSENQKIRKSMTSAKNQGIDDVIRKSGSRTRARTRIPKVSKREFPWNTESEQREFPLKSMLVGLKKCIINERLRNYRFENKFKFLIYNKDEQSNNQRIESHR